MLPAFQALLSLLNSTFLWSCFLVVQVNVGVAGYKRKKNTERPLKRNLFRTEYFLLCYFLIHIWNNLRQRQKIYVDYIRAQWYIISSWWYSLKRVCGDFARICLKRNIRHTPSCNSVSRNQQKETDIAEIKTVNTFSSIKIVLNRIKLKMFELAKTETE